MNRISLGLVWILGATTVLSACTSVPARTVSHDADVAAIMTFNQQYLKAINAGDANALAALTDDDHIMIPANGSPILGKAANVAANARLYEQFQIDEHWAPAETVVEG